MSVRGGRRSGAVAGAGLRARLRVARPNTHGARLKRLRLRRGLGVALRYRALQRALTREQDVSVDGKGWHTWRLGKLTGTDQSAKQALGRQREHSAELLAVRLVWKTHSRSVSSPK
jgi:hypothetical protein